VRALIPLGMPAIIFGGILGGIMTPTEASVVAVLYAALVGLFVYREIAWVQLPEILVQSAAVTGAVGLLLATAGVISWFLTLQPPPPTSPPSIASRPGTPPVFSLHPAFFFLLLRWGHRGSPRRCDPPPEPPARGNPALHRSHPLRHRDR